MNEDHTMSNDLLFNVFQKYTEREKELQYKKNAPAIYEIKCIEPEYNDKIYNCIINKEGIIVAIGGVGHSKFIERSAFKIVKIIGNVKLGDTYNPRVRYEKVYGGKDHTYKYSNDERHNWKPKKYPFLMYPYSDKERKETEKNNSAMTDDVVNDLIDQLGM